jgi:C4-dicarboxylate transporter DctM subunit
MELIEYIGLGTMILLFMLGSPWPSPLVWDRLSSCCFPWDFQCPMWPSCFFSTINSYTLLAMPFFILAGNLILKSGGMVPLRNFMNAMVGHWPGGMAVATIIFAAFLGSISGSAAACLAIIGTVVVPILVESGYDRPFSSGMTVCAAELGMLIPPSLFFILFGAFNQVSIADLFMAGIGPGFLSAFLMCIVAVVISKRRKYTTSDKASWKERWKTFIQVFPVMLMPFVVLGGIYSGIFSPTQAASVSVYYALILGVFVYKAWIGKGSSIRWWTRPSCPA